MKQSIKQTTHEFPATRDKSPIPTPLTAEYADCKHSMQTKRCKLLQWILKKTIFADMQLIMRISAQVRYSFKCIRLVGSVIDLFLVSFSHNSCCGHELHNHYIWSNIWISQILAQVGETRNSLFAIIDDNIAKIFYMLQFLSKGWNYAQS